MKTPRPFITISTVTFLVFLLAGCYGADEANPISVDAQHPAPQDVQFNPIATPEHALATMRIPPSERTAEQQAFADSALRAGSYAGAATRHLIKEAARRGQGWTVVDGQIRRMLGRFQRETAYGAEQSASLSMLGFLLQSEALTPEQQAAIAFYTELLLENESPAADVLLRSLKGLKSYWSDEAVVQAAARTVQNTEAWLSREVETAGKAETVFREQPNREDLLDARARRLLAVREAVKSLKVLSL